MKNDIKIKQGNISSIKWFLKMVNGITWAGSNGRTGRTCISGGIRKQFDQTHHKYHSFFCSCKKTKPKLYCIHSVCHTVLGTGEAEANPAHFLSSSGFNHWGWRKWGEEREGKKEWREKEEKEKIEIRCYRYYVEIHMLYLCRYI